jgi:hypothetical protein
MAKKGNPDNLPIATTPQSNVDFIEVFGRRHFVHGKEYDTLPVSWYWHAKAGNGEIVAQSEAFTRESDARRAAEAVFPEIRIVELGAN